jgi:CRISPR-associated protein Csm1
MNNQSTAKTIALQVFQQGTKILAYWADTQVLEGFNCESNEVINQSKQLLNWQNNCQIEPLRLLFDHVKISNDEQNLSHYLAPKIISDEFPNLPYPQENRPDLEKFKQQVKQDLESLHFNQELWNNLDFLSVLLEKYGSFLAFTAVDIALTDVVKSTAAIASALAITEDSENLTLISGDLSGIQNFIYTISSDGALKSLRARSFYLELVTEEIVQQLLEKLQLPRSSVIYAGGGNLYILAPQLNNLETIINDLKKSFNKWLFRTFDGKIFLALDFVELPIKNLNNQELSKAWQEIPQKLGRQKQRKFDSLLDQYLTIKPSYQACQVCHKDDQLKLKPLNKNETLSSQACWQCCQMFQLGSELFKVKAIARFAAGKKRHFPQSVFKICIARSDYYLFTKLRPDYKNAKTLYLINNWNLAEYEQGNTTNLLLGNYYKVTEIEGETGFMRAEEMTEKAEGIARVGYLRMDVDNLGKIFAKGLGNKQNLSRLSSLSRQMTYFFKVYLNSLAKNRDREFLLHNFQSLTQSARDNLLFIYAGGDDLFISGVWHEVVEFAFDIYQSFRAYTGYNSDITLSGGIALETAKFPLYQAATESGEAESEAKNNGRDSLGLFGEVFKWEEWLGKTDINVNQINCLTSDTRTYLGGNTTLELFGILPIVNQLQDTAKFTYSRNFIQNLLTVAKIQEQKVKEIEDKKRTETYNNELQDIRYYLHLPKIAYTLARLPNNVKNNPNFKPISTALKSPYNAPYFRAIATWIELLHRSS